jgi:signal peptidase I
MKSKDNSKKSQAEVKELQDKIKQLKSKTFKTMDGSNFASKSWNWYRNKKKISDLDKQVPKSFGEVVKSWFSTIFGAILVVMILNGILIASFVVPTGSMENTVMTGDFLFVNKFLYGPSTPQVIPFLNIPLPFYKTPGIKDPKQGDVIVFIFPGNRDEEKSKEFQYYLKRCVATAGDTIQVINKRVFVNGVEFGLPEHGRYEPFQRETQYDKFRTFPVGAGFTPNNYGPLRIPKIGDEITLTPQNWRQWEMFIKREGHTMTFDGTNVIIDSKPTTKYNVLRNYCFGMGDNRDNSLDSRFFGFIPFENVVGTPMIVYMSLPDKDEFERPYTLFERIMHMRFERIGKIIL